MSFGELQLRLDEDDLSVSTIHVDLMRDALDKKLNSVEDGSFSDELAFNNFLKSTVRGHAQEIADSINATIERACPKIRSLLLSQLIDGAAEFVGNALDAGASKLEIILRADAPCANVNEVLMNTVSFDLKDNGVGVHIKGEMGNKQRLPVGQSIYVHADTHSLHDSALHTDKSEHAGATAGGAHLHLRTVCKSMQKLVHPAQKNSSLFGIELKNHSGGAIVGVSLPKSVLASHSLSMRELINFFKAKLLADEGHEEGDDSSSDEELLLPPVKGSLLARRGRGGLSLGDDSASPSTPSRYSSTTPMFIAEQRDLSGSSITPPPAIPFGAVEEASLS